MTVKKMSDVMKHKSFNLEKNTDQESRINFYDELPPIDEQTALFVNYIFERLAGIIPTFKYSTDCIASLNSIRREYTYAIIKENIKSSKQVNTALDNIREVDPKFLPTPQEFVEFCKAAQNEIQAPSVDAAYREACHKSHPNYGEKKWSHPAVEYAYKLSDPFFLRTESARKTRPVFEKNYKIACEQYANNRIMDQIEDKTKDSLQNQLLYQEYWGGMQTMKRFNPQCGSKILTYNEWLKSECRK